jgi:U4/U6 small nuclear ribonucleoprotein PRP3
VLTLFCSESVVQREAPPDIEWWDEPLLPSKSYDDLATNAAKISTDDSPITIYVQHPVQIAAPWDKKKVEARPLMLTKKANLLLLLIPLITTLDLVADPAC